jgi:hypothetical protein
MNEIKQRVTDEHIKTDLMLYGDDTEMTKYALDLRDSRAIIENQAELIKEMRDLIARVMKSGFATGCTCQNCKTARSILDHTKDYA